jgi:hypothetical protein
MRLGITLIALGICLGLLVFGLSQCSTEYTVDNWKHGKVLCDAEVIMINLGHEDDSEVTELFKLAKKCNE